MLNHVFHLYIHLFTQPVVIYLTYFFKPSQHIYFTLIIDRHALEKGWYITVNRFVSTRVKVHIRCFTPTDFIIDREELWFPTNVGMVVNIPTWNALRAAFLRGGPHKFTVKDVYIDLGEGMFCKFDCYGGIVIGRVRRNGKRAIKITLPKEALARLEEM